LRSCRKNCFNFIDFAFSPLNCLILRKINFMSFIEELKWRGMLHDCTPGVEELLSTQKVTGYIGFDPTAPSLTIGNYVQIMLLTFLKKHGHTPIVLMGGATGRIGDPSGKNEERQLKTYEELDFNLAHQSNQMLQFLGSDPANPIQIVNNYDFYKEMPVLEFLRVVGKHLTVNYMLSKDSVQNRLEQGISFTEFSYQLLQGYDFYCLKEKHNVLLQMGGSDQWGNITSGTELIRRINGGKAYALTTPLLTKADGTKFGKSDKGNIWLDAKLTTPYQFYQFWINADDRDMPKFYRYFSLKEKEEIESIETTYQDDPKTLKRILAEELTSRIHGEASLAGIQQVSALLFDPKFDAAQLGTLSPAQFDIIGEEIPTFHVVDGNTEIPMDGLLTEKSNIFPSKSELRRAVQSNALSINKIKITAHDHNITQNDFVAGKYILVENGKKNKYLLVFNQ